MFFWSGFPFVRVVIFFMAGILLGIYCPGAAWPAWLACLLAGICLLVGGRYRQRWFLPYNPAYGLVLSLWLLALGYLFVLAATEELYPEHLGRFRDFSHYQVQVRQAPVKKGQFYQLAVSAEAVRLPSGWQRACGRVLLYLKPDSAYRPAPGDRLLLSGQPAAITPPRNPFEFDYRQYLAFNNIHHRQFVYPGQYLLLPANASRSSLLARAYRVRQKLEARLANVIAGPGELAVAQALILGDKQDLSKPLLDAYARAGAMHVLAVSGLHAGIIYLILLLLLGERKNRLRRPWLAGLVVIPALWGYAFLTGLSPSVLRATTMFSLLAIGQMLSRRANTFNLLALSAFLLLAVNPYLLMSVGFQLSYLAVAGILLLYPHLAGLWQPAAKGWRLIWQITALSVAAQLATAPLSALYFHRFPPYFLVSNLLVIPAATLIVWGGVALLALGWLVPGWERLLGILLEGLIGLMNRLLSAIATWPGSDVSGLAPTVAETWLIYALLAGGFLYYRYRQRWCYYTTLTTACLLAILLLLSEYRSARMQQIVFYSTGHLAVDFVINRQFQSWLAPGLAEDPEQVAFLITPYRRYHGLRPAGKPLSHHISGLGTVVVWQGYRVLLTNRCLASADIPEFFDFVMMVPGRDQKCAHKPIVLRKLVLQGQTVYRKHDLTAGALVVDI